MQEFLGWMMLIAIGAAIVFRLIYLYCDRDLTITILTSIAGLVLIFLVGVFLAGIWQIFFAVVPDQTEKVVTMYSENGTPACSWDTTDNITESTNSIEFISKDGIEITIKDAPVVIKEKN